MELYWAPQSRSFTALWMMEEVGCAYERVLVDIRAGAQKSEAYRAVNPMMKVPALVDGDAKLAEVPAICAYLADRFAQAGLAPALDDPARGRYLHALFFAVGGIEPAITQKLTGMAIDPVMAGWGDYDRTIAAAETFLAPGPWILGTRFSAADVVVGSLLYYGMDLIKAIEPRPAFRDHVARCAERPAFQRASAIDDAATPA